MAKFFLQFRLELSRRSINRCWHTQHKEKVFEWYCNFVIGVNTDRLHTKALFLGSKRKIVRVILLYFIVDDLVAIDSTFLCPYDKEVVFLGKRKRTRACRPLYLIIDADMLAITKPDSVIDVESTLTIFLQYHQMPLIMRIAKILDVRSQICERVLCIVLWYSS